MFEEIKAIVKEDLNQRNLTGIRKSVEERVCLDAATIEQAMKGRNSVKSAEILQACIDYCDSSAKKAGIKIKGESYKHRVMAIGEESTLVSNPLILAKQPADDGVDIWTPGVDPDRFVAIFSKKLDEEAANRLIELSEKCISEVAEGKFEHLLITAESAKSLGQDCGNRRVVGEANYLLGESLRLIADFTEDRIKSESLRKDAIDAYEMAIEQLEYDPRPIRGRARTFEVEGDLSTAATGFETSLSISMLKDTNHPTHQFSYAHEQLRSIRHKLNCLSAMHKKTTCGTVTHSKEKAEIRALVEQSTKLHIDYLPMFENFSNWWRIEWFMAEVLHAKALIAINEYQSATLRLERAMSQRLKMMEGGDSISDVERGNISWWVKTAQGASKGFQEGQHQQLDNVLNKLGENASKALLKNQLSKFINMGSSPWKN